MTSKVQFGGGLIPLLVIATAQLMLVLDDSIVNIALPSIQDELGVAAVHLPWVVNAYILAFGALLLLGGRIGDLWGRKRTLQTGIAIFIVASLVGGLGQNTLMLIVARAAQGVGAAMAAPNALALITTTFSERSMRDKALFLYGAMSGIGIVIGLLVLAGTRTLVAAGRHAGRLGTLGAVLGTGGMVALVYTITRFGEDGFTDPIAYILIVAAAVLLVVFVLTQRGSQNPLVPLSLFTDRNRAGAYLTMLGLAIGPMGTLYVITLYLQQVRDYTPLTTGLAWLPFAVGIVVGAGGAPKLLLAVSARYVTAVGALLSAVGAFWFSRISMDTGYWLGLAPAMFLVALGFGIGVIALTQAAVYRVDPDKAGIASALLNSAQQIGVALGLAILASVAATITARADNTALPPGEALVAGYSTALVAGSGILIAAALLALFTLDAKANTESE
ncbi:MFS transporter [Aeromicrobium sp. PE09-221]|uniref:MFS transporter n=1 Tax=Aeromicrobium sp. PE09-221 TaxID=1898043 RepID=UPI000B3EBC48|nr:MFS transporter [Aeromicrobium sp. PE09-221]OUZ07222.1 MFS transporter [Aeromicrobium sp. PE09-221]